MTCHTFCLCPEVDSANGSNEAYDSDMERGNKRRDNAVFRYTFLFFFSPVLSLLLANVAETDEKIPSVEKETSFPTYSSRATTMGTVVELKTMLVSVELNTPHKISGVRSHFLM